MKKTILIAFIVLYYCIAGRAQINMVPNPSFEIYDTCPDLPGQIERAIGWINLTSSCDLYNRSSNNTQIEVPSNMLGYQAPANEECNGYCGIYAYFETGNYREYFSAALFSPLIIGQKYFISFYVSLADSYNCGINKIGIVFSSSLLPYSGTTIFANFLNYAHVYSNNVITDKTNWTKVQGEFVADSNYHYINIGNFFDNNNTDTIRLDTFFCVSYYYIDDICVSLDSLTCNPGIEICSVDVEEINLSNLFNVYPNPFEQETTVIINNSQQPIDLRIYDMFGRDVSKQFTLNIENISGLKIKINRNVEKNGIYILKLSTKNKTYNSKLIIN